MKRLKVCLCISGQMRAFEHNFGWVDNLSARHDVSIVVSTSHDRGGKLFGHFDALRSRNLIAGNLLDALPPSWLNRDLFEQLPGLRQAALDRARDNFITPETIRAVLPGAHVQIDGPLEVGWFERPQFVEGNRTARDPFALQMLYRIWRADLMRQNLQVDPSVPFDVVVRLRPDRPLTGLDDTILSGLRPGLIYVEAMREQDGFLGDQFAIADAATMDVYASFFFHAYLKAKAGEWTDVHKEFWDYLAKNGLEVKTHNPLLDYATESLLGVNDLVAALARRSDTLGEGLSGYTPVSPSDVSALIGLVRSADAITSSRAALQQPSTLDGVRSIIEVFDPDRDCGFLFWIASNQKHEISVGTRLLCLALALSGVTKSGLIGSTYAYVMEFCDALETSARLGAEVHSEPEKLLDALLVGASDQPLGQMIAARLADPSLAARALTGMSAAFDQLFRDPGFWLRVVAHLRRAERHLNAEAILTRVTERCPDFGLGWLQLALTLCDVGKPIEARNAVGRGVELAVDHAESFDLAALIYSRADDLQAAESAARRALELEPKEERYIQRLAEIVDAQQAT